MLEDQWQTFLDDVRRVGVREPVLVQRDNLLLDGRHRLRVARERGDPTIPAIVVDWSEPEQEDYILRTALLRRHLTDDQRASLAGHWVKLETARSKGERARRGGQRGGRGRPKATAVSSVDAPVAELSASCPVGERAPRVVENAAKKFGVSERKIRAAIKVQNENPDLSEEVLAGKTTLSAAKRAAKNRAPKYATRTEGGSSLPSSNTPSASRKSVPIPPAAAASGALVPADTAEVLAHALIRLYGVDKALIVLDGAYDIALRVATFAEAKSGATGKEEDL
jgi:ParB-like chromosome segregation protein Spo0J